MTKKSLTQLLQDGGIAVGVLTNPESFVLCFMPEDEQYFIPLIRKEGRGFAYIDPDKADDAHYEQLVELIERLNSDKIFTTMKFTPRYGKEPEFVKEITSFIKPTGINYVLPKGVKAALEKEGYAISINLTSDFPYQERDYGTQIEDNLDFKMQYEEELNEIKELNITFETLPVEVQRAMKMIKAGAKDGIIFTGPTGSGKTVLSKVVACYLKAHREDIQLTPDTQVEDLVGKYVANDKDNSKASWRFAEGPLLKSWYTGYVFTVQEIGTAATGINTCINRYTDSTCLINENDKNYHKHHNFVMIATTNNGYDGREKLDPSVKGRFSIIHIPGWTEDQYVKVLTEYSVKLGHKLRPEFIKDLLKLAAAVEKTGRTWHETFEFSVRNSKRFLDDILYEPVTFDDFCGSFHMEYTNYLNCDNKNDDKLTKYKNDEFITNSLKSLYELYDFTEITEATSKAKSFASYFSSKDDEDEEVSEEARKTFSKKMADKFGLE